MSPVGMVGKHNGLSFIFLMGQLFERYVAKQLQRQLPLEFKLKQQAFSHCLTHPKHVGFTEPLALFEFKPELTLYVVPYDLETD
ncbi:5-methylcytosine restriction system specificity protein McrC [Shewanella baltica]|uniref:5-methylcytosine restriction system specificity protein McrC n=1 Tax=Shewanella baltica TaxID=62322 RepID=UPI0039AFD6F4